MFKDGVAPSIPPFLDKMMMLEKKINSLTHSKSSIEELANYIITKHDNGNNIEVINLISTYIFIDIYKMQSYVRLIEILLENNYFNLVDFYTIGKRKRSKRLIYYLHKNGRTSLNEIIEIAKYNPGLYKYFPYLKSSDPNDNIPIDLDFTIINFFPKDSLEYKILKGDYIDLPEDDKLVDSPFLELPKKIKTIYGINLLYGSQKCKNLTALTDITIYKNIWTHTDVKEENLNQDHLHEAIKSLNYGVIYKIISHKIEYVDDKKLPIRDSLSIYLLLRNARNIRLYKRTYAREGSNEVLNYIWNENDEIFPFDSIFVGALQGNNLPMIKKLITFVDQNSLKVKYAIFSRNLNLVKYLVEERFQIIEYIDLNIALQIVAEDIFIYLIKNYKGYIGDNFKKITLQKILTHRLTDLLKFVVKFWKLDKNRKIDIDLEMLLEPYIEEHDIAAIEMVADSGLHPEINRIKIVNNALATNDRKLVEAALKLVKWDTKFASILAAIVETKFPDLAQKILSFEIPPINIEHGP